MDCDVAIAGGGFAGLSAAQSCARRDISCCLFEQSDEIGYPIHTSGGSFIPDMEHLGIPDELYHPIEQVEFISPSEVATFDYDDPKFCVIDVRGVQQYLAEEAVAAGATIRTDARVNDVLIQEEGIVAGVTVRSGKEETIRSSVTIDATGFKSVVAQKSGLHDGFERFGRGVEFDLYAPEYNARTARLIVGNDIIPAGYAWIFPYRKDRIRVGVGSLFPDKTTDLHRSISQIFDRYKHLGLDRGAQLEKHTGVIPSQSTPKQLVDDGILLAGDAANFPFGLVGEGIRMALETGKMAGQVAAESVHAGNTSRSQLEPYQNYWESKYKRSHQISQAVNEKLAEIEDSQWDQGTQILQTFDPEEFYDLLRSDFTRKKVLDFCLSHPVLLFSLGKIGLKVELNNIK